MRASLASVLVSSVRRRVHHHRQGSVASASTSAEEQPMQRTLATVVLGAPNTGKSALANQLVRAGVSAVSSKMDTTQQNVTCVITEGSVQLTIVDSPGAVGPGHARNVARQQYKDSRLVTDQERALERAEHVLVVQDATATGDYIHHRVMHMLHRHPHVPSSLVINKIDLIPRREELLELTRILTMGRVGGREIVSARTQIGNLGRVDEDRPAGLDVRNSNTNSTNNELLPVFVDNSAVADDPAFWEKKYRQLMLQPTHTIPYGITKKLFMPLRGWPHFQSVFFVSALTGEGCDELRDHLYRVATPRPWPLDSDTVTTKSPKALCCELIRAALLDSLPGDVAYRLEPRINEWHVEGEVLQIVVDIECEKKRWAPMVLGPAGKRLEAIGQRVNQHLSDLFHQQLFVRILVKHHGKMVDP